MNNKFKDWCNKNLLEVEQLESSIYKIDNKLFLLIEGEEGKILSNKNKLLLSPLEEKLVKSVNFVVFLWGENFYYTPKEKIKDPEFNIFRYFGSLNIGLPFLGVHGKYELLSGSREYEDWCKKAKFLGCSSLGICEKNTLAGVLDFQQTCKSYGLFSIIGETIVIKDKKGKLLSGKCFVKNDTGWKNLLLVNTQINVLSVNQCIEEEKLLEFGEGLVFIFHPSYFPFNEKKIELYKKSFSQCYFQLETCSYTNEESDRNFLLNTGKYLSSTLLKPILISDAYYLEEEDSHIRSILSFLSEKRDLLSTNQYFKNFQQEIVILSQLFEKDEDFQIIINSCVESLVEVERDCKSFEIQTGVFKLPKYKMTEEESQKYETNEDLFYDLIDKNFPLKVPLDKEEKYSERLVRELSVIQRGGFIDYFLILWDIVKWCKENDILTGIGRGSAGGSLVAYILEITRIDPIEYNLLFERFLNEGRLGKSLPDIDTDFESLKKPLVKKYLEKKYGEDKVCSIGTYTTFQIKAAIKDLSRVKGLDIGSVELVSKLIGGETTDGRFFREPWSYIFQAGTKNQVIGNFISENPDIIRDVELILGQPKASSVHACATLILPEDESIFTSVPIRRGEVNGEELLVSEWEGEFIEKAGYLKEDILGVSQLDKFRMIMNLVEKYYNEEIDIYNIPLDKKEVFKMFGDGFSGDVFHLGSNSLSRYGVQVKPEKMEDLIAMLAVYRPGPIESNAHNDFVLLRHGEKEPNFYPGTEEITKETYSLIIYQEQIMQICQKIGSFSLVEADDIRKAMGKLDQKLLDSYKDRWFKGALGNGYSQEVVSELWSKMVSFGGYAFNRSHAAAYAITGYICQYLKYKYPLPYWITALEFALDKNIPRFLSEINNSSEITVTPPDINKSQLKFSADFTKDQIIWSISKVKQCGEISVDLIFQERQENGPFFSLEEFLSRVNKSKINKSVVENLIISGAFDDLEKVSSPVQRKDLIKKYRDIMNIKVDKSKDWFELNKNQKFFYEDWWWSLKQREVSGLAFFDYLSLIEKTQFKPSKFRLIQDLKNIVNIDFNSSKIVTGGVILSIEEKSSKKGVWCKILLEQNYESIYLYLWSDIYLKYKSVLVGLEGKIMFCRARLLYEDFQKENILQGEDDFEFEVL